MLHLWGTGQFRTGDGGGDIKVCSGAGLAARCSHLVARHSLTYRPISVLRRGVSIHGSNRASQATREAAWQTRNFTIGFRFAPTYSESILQQQRQTTTNNRPGQLQINCAVLPVPETADQRRLQLQRLRSLQRMQFVVERPFPPAENPRGSVFCV